MTKLIIKSFKDILDFERQIIKSELHAWTKNNKIIMSKENIEKLKDIFRKYEIEFDEKNFVYNTIIGSIPIIEEIKK